MNRSKFIQTLARIRVLEKDLLNQPIYDRLIENKDLNKASYILSDPVYQTGIHSLENDRNYKHVLKQELIRTLKDLYETSSDPRPVDLLSAQHRYRDPEILVKESMIHQDLETSYVPLGLPGIKKAQEPLDGHEDKVTSEGLDRAVKIMGETMDIYEEWSDPQDVDLYIDQAQIYEMQELIDKTDVGMFRDYLEAYIDFPNIGTFSRSETEVVDSEFLQEVLYEGGETPEKDHYAYLNTGLNSDNKMFANEKIAKYVRRSLDVFDEKNSLSQLEDELDQYCMNLIKESKTITYGPEIIFPYGLAKEMEIKSLHLILTAKANDIPSENIKGRPRDSHV